MSIFSIKLKTKNGNDVKRKETFTVCFRLKYRKGLKTSAEYTYRIIYSKGVDDPQTVLELKNPNQIKSIEDLTVKVMLNFCHIITQICDKHKIDPDFIMFISPDFEKSQAWKFLNSAFKRPGKQAVATPNDPLRWVRDFTEDYEKSWTAEKCGKMGIRKDELDMLKAFADLNPNTVLMTFDPNRDPKKYARSIAICNKLQDRINRQLQIETDPY